MYVDNSIIEKFKKIKLAFEDQPIRRLLSDDDKGGYLISSVSKDEISLSGGFYEKYCTEKLEIKDL